MYMYDSYMSDVATTTDRIEIHVFWILMVKTMEKQFKLMFAVLLFYLSTSSLKVLILIYFSLCRA